MNTISTSSHLAQIPARVVSRLPERSIQPPRDLAGAIVAGTFALLADRDGRMARGDSPAAHP